MHEEKAALQAVGALTIQESLNQVELLQALQGHQEQLSTRLEDCLQSNLVEALTQYRNLEHKQDLQAATMHNLDTPINANAVRRTTTTDPILAALNNLTQQLATLTTLQTNNCQANIWGLMVITTPTYSACIKAWVSSAYSEEAIIRR